MIHIKDFCKIASKRGFFYIFNTRNCSILELDQAGFNAFQFLQQIRTESEFFKYCEEQKIPVEERNIFLDVLKNEDFL